MTTSEAEALVLASYTADQLNAFIAKYSAEVEQEAAAGRIGTAANAMCRVETFKAELDKRA